MIGLSQWVLKLTKELNLWLFFVSAMIMFYNLTVLARRLDISILENDPEVFKQEALKYTKLFRDNYIHLYNNSI